MKFLKTIQNNIKNKQNNMENILNNAKLSLYHLPHHRGCARCLGFHRRGGILENYGEMWMSNPRTCYWRVKK